MNIAASLGDVPAIKATRKHYVAEEEVSGALLTPIQSLLGRCGLNHFEAGLFEGVHRYGPHQIIVVSHEHSHRGTVLGIIRYLLGRANTSTAGPHFDLLRWRWNKDRSAAFQEGSHRVYDGVVGHPLGQPWSTQEYVITGRV